MNLNRSIAVAVVLVASFIASATAQIASPGQGDGTATTAITVPAGSLQKTQNAWRGRTLIGTPVFNDSGQQIATINDLLITDEGVVDRVVPFSKAPPVGGSPLQPVPFGSEPEYRKTSWAQRTALHRDCDHRVRVVWRHAAWRQPGQSGQHGGVPFRPIAITQAIFSIPMSAVWDVRDMRETLRTLEVPPQQIAWESGDDWRRRQPAGGTIGDSGDAAGEYSELFLTTRVIVLTTTLLPPHRSPRC